MMTVALILAVGPTCLPVPPEIARMGDEAVVAFNDARAKWLDDALKDPRTPRFASAPRAARPLMAMLWSRRDDPSALKFLKDYGGEPPASAQLKAALEGKCTVAQALLSCSSKTSSITLELTGDCWRWVGFR